jgi:hypothetical protein
LAGLVAYPITVMPARCPARRLIFLASAQVPARWIDYVDRDREIGAAWRSEDGFKLTDRARRALGI